MALQKTAMIANRSEGAKPRIYPKRTESVIFAQAGAIKTLPVGTVLAFNTSTNGYVEWATGGVNETGIICAVVYPDPVIVTTAGEVAGTVMMAGEAHRDDLVSDGGTSGQLDAALAAPATRRMDLFVRALADYRE